MVSEVSMENGSEDLVQAATSFTNHHEEYVHLNAQIESAAGEIDTQWQGQGAQAFHQSHQRYQEVSQKIATILNDIQEKLTHAGAQYTQQEEEAAQALNIHL
jgi:WXG100 family type VII secretion target